MKVDDRISQEVSGSCRGMKIDRVNLISVAKPLILFNIVRAVAR